MESGPLGAGNAPQRPFPVGLSLGFYALMAAAGVAWRALASGEAAWLAPGAAPPSAEGLLGQGALGVAVGLVVVAGSRLWTRHSPSGQRLSDALAATLGPLPTRTVVWLALASGLGEEILFRGALQPQVGLVWASLVFALAHFLPRREFAPWAVFALVVGVLFGALFDWTGSVVAPAVAHVTVNALNLHWLANSDAARRSP